MRRLSALALLRPALVVGYLGQEPLGQRRPIAWLPLPLQTGEKRLPLRLSARGARGSLAGPDDRHRLCGAIYHRARPPLSRKQRQCQPVGRFRVSLEAGLERLARRL